jgi:hypothetical protein
MNWLFYVTTVAFALFAGSTTANCGVFIKIPQVKKSPFTFKTRVLANPVDIHKTCFTPRPLVNVIIQIYIIYI